ncbi:hypothetical protein [Pseudoduganella lutea]|uniref:Peptidase M4 domain-containing protein n=1 Tax=Pseudoduganella lutea TaxID=321985 RepID=A0A4P6KX73_9BURK|nr:hypothetical protein [Pseudoduganella lutea]QBE62838.1 hypothetical protein EWM63_07560 [Pseudoduganella lutea]
MDQKVIVPRLEAVLTTRPDLPVGFVPTPTASYRLHRKVAKLTEQPGAPQLKMAPGVPQRVSAASAGARVLMWKQDPSVSDMGTRKAYLHGVILEGPRDARIASGQPGIAPVSPNAFGDFIAPPDSEQFDAVHTFTVVRQTLTMYQRVLAADDSGALLPWAWNSGKDTAPLQVFPHGLPNVMNAYYSRNERALKFGHFIPSGAAERMFTCRSFDIVAHEAAHAVLDGLKPQWILSSAPPQTGGLHESFGDLTAIFLALSQMDQVEAVIAQTKADLHDKTFLADMAEQFGLALGRSNGLRNADNDLTLAETGDQVHAISQVFTGAMYDILADMFAFERQPGVEDDAAVLYRVGGYLCSLTLRAIVAAPDRAATFVDVVNHLLRLAEADGKPVEYRNFIRNRFALRGVVDVDIATLSDDVAPHAKLAPVRDDRPQGVQDRRACCGTMNNAQYFDLEDVLEAERQALARWCQGHAARHQHRGPAATDGDDVAVNN